MAQTELGSRLCLGRDEELARLGDALAAGRGARGGLLLVTGDAGIGKTRVVEVATAEAVTVWGRCWESDGAPAFWPWIEALRALVALRGAESLRELAPGAAAEAARLVEELDPSAEAPTGESDAATRFALFDGVAQLLLASAAAEPLVVVLEDLHAGDPASLRLIELLAPRLGSAPLVVIATFRLRDVGTDPQLERMLAALARRGEHVPLAGLDRQAARSLALASAAAPLPEPTVRQVVSRAEGNPFFVEALALAAGEAGEPPDALPLPAEVGEAIARRLDHLSPGTRTTLAAAAVIGHTFTVDRVARLRGIASDEALALIDPAARAGLVLPARAPGEMRFAHNLIRDWLYAGLDPSERAELHCREAADLERRAERDPELLGALAYHLAAAAPVAGAAGAVAACEAAARHALERLAFEDAAALYGRALAIADGALEPLEPERRAALLLAQGDAHLRAGDAGAAREALLGAANLARAGGLPRELGYAALGFGRVVVRPGEIDKTLVALLEQALDVVPAGEPVLRARLLARLARELHFSPDPARPRALAREAVALADEAGGPADRAYTLAAMHVSIDVPDTVDDRLGIARRVVELAREGGDLELELEGRLMCAVDTLELGRPAAAADELDEAELLASRLRQPALTWRVLLVRGTLAMIAGRFDEAERVIAEAEDVGARARGRGGYRYRLLQEGGLRDLRGGYAELEEELRALADEAPAVWGILLTHLLVTTGQVDEARERFEQSAATDFGGPLVHMASLSQLGRWADICVALDDAERAAVLYERLLPHADRWPVGAGSLFLGTVRMRLGTLARAMGRHDDAVEHLRTAVAQQREAGATPMATRAEFELARGLLASGRADEADDVLGHALRVARALGMAPLAGEIEASRGAQPAPGEARLAQEGEYWVARFRGRDVRLRDRKGIGYLATLLAGPHQEVAALTLAAGEPGMPDGDAGEMLDADAKSAYRRRVEELRAEIEEAERWNDAERERRASAELEFVTAELSRAVGLGGRSRRAASNAERARVSVTRAIRSAIAAIAEQDAELGRHLEDSVRTGTHCRYAPAAGDEVAWRVSRSG
jgi:tetratricopeptide (TPR) repeat protein